MEAGEYGGLRTDQAKRLKDLEKENARLKRLLAVEHVRDTLGRDEVTERRACRVLGQARNTQRRKASVADDEPRLVKRIVWMASEYGRYGDRRMMALLRAEGWCLTYHWHRGPFGRLSSQDLRASASNLL